MKSVGLGFVGASRLLGAAFEDDATIRREADDGFVRQVRVSRIDFLPDLANFEIDHRISSVGDGVASIVTLAVVTPGTVILSSLASKTR
jgi:hypothetical protein